MRLARFTTPKAGRASRALLVAALLPLLGCEKDNAYIPPPPPQVRVAHPVEKAITRYFTLTGNTQAFQTVALEARVQGYLDKISYVDGARVTKGAPLFLIQQNTYQAQLEQAKAALVSQQATLANTKSEFYRQSTLGEERFASQAHVEDAKTRVDKSTADVESARANVEIAQINLGYTNVVAPFDGIVTHHLVDVGALVGVAGPTKLATIVQIDPLYVYFSVSEAQVLEVKRDLARRGLRVSELHAVPVEIGMQSETGYPHAGTLDYVSPEVDPQTGTLLLRGIFDNKTNALVAGLFVRVRVPVGKEKAALLVKDDVIGTSQAGSYVLVVGSDGTVGQRTVKLGERDGELRVIEAGLEPGDWVVVDGLQRAVPGSKVDPLKSGADTADAKPSTATAAPARQ